MGVVVVIDPGRRHGTALDRLTRELQGHEIVVATSGDEALVVLEGQVPDLVLFPLYMAPADEARMHSRLRALVSQGDVQALTIPLSAFFEWEARAARPSAVPPRWFYWFKPAATTGFDFPDPRDFGAAVRAGVHRSVMPVIEEVPEPVPMPAPAPVVPEDRAPQPVAWRSSALEPELAAFSEPHVETRGRELFAEPEESEPGRVAVIRAAISAAAMTVIGLIRRVASQAWPLIARLFSLAGPASARVSSLAGQMPRAVWIAAPVLTILLTLGVAGRITRLATAPVSWAGDAKERWFPVPGKMGIADIQTVPDGVQVWLNGRQIGVTPLRAEFAVGSHEVELRYRGSTRTLTLDVTPGNTVMQRIEWAPATRVSGKLRVESDPAGAIVVIDGKPQGVTPLTADDLSVGQHAVDLTLRGNTVHETVEIKAAKTTTLRTSVYQGWLALFSPIELKVAVDGRALALDDHNRVLLSAGSHELTLQNRALGYNETQTVAIKPGDTTAVSVALPKTTLSVTASGPAEVWIDGAPAGPSPIVDFPVDIGTREVLLRSVDHGERRLTVTATVAPVRVAVDLAAPPS